MALALEKGIDPFFSILESSPLEVDKIFIRLYETLFISSTKTGVPKFTGEDPFYVSGQVWTNIL